MKFKEFIKCLWELPQNIGGAIVKKAHKAELLTTYKDANVYSWCGKCGLSLGKYIFIPFAKANSASYTKMRLIKHEYGHRIQSKYLGWFYLLVIGLPSLVWNQCFGWYRKKTGKSYYDFYTEKWADKLGGVER